MTDRDVPSGLRACLFDLDGVVTRTATLHAAAWKEMFDAFLAGYGREHGAQPGVDTSPFDADRDYHDHVDGRPRLDGVRTFLAARGIHLPEGTDDDPPGTWTVHALGTAKNRRVVERIRAGDVEVYDDSVTFLKAVRAAGLRTAVVSSSANTLDVLRATGIEGLFEARVDGVVARERQLPGKPAPDTFLAGAAELGLDPTACMVLEDALAGVEAGRAGGFGLVVGVDRQPPGSGHGEALRAHGAGLVVRELTEIPLPGEGSR